MPRLPRTTDRLTLELQTYGATSSRVLASKLGVSGPTLSRMIAEVGPQIERIGAARSTRYALRRTIAHFGGEWPIYRVAPNGRIFSWGTLRALHGGFRFLPAIVDHPWGERLRVNDGLSGGLPFFLHDARPQGFLGRAIARRLAGGLGLPPNLQMWNDDHNISYFLTHGDDLPGDIIVGDAAMERAGQLLRSPATTAIAAGERAEIYPRCVEAVQRGEVIGSSAGGEQPKFLATVQSATAGSRSLLVKFSPTGTSPAATRWSDLLACEHIASEVLRARGIQSAVTSLLDAGGRRFLEVERFDRTVEQGRRGLVSLGVLEDEYLSHATNDWADASVLLLQSGLVEEGVARALRWVWCFGDLIANSDMHRANASFWFPDKATLELAPVYDMLPMQYAPNAQGELPHRDYSPRAPRASVTDVWIQAAAAARDFWVRISTSSLVSEPFRAIAAKNQSMLSEQVDRQG